MSFSGKVIKRVIYISLLVRGKFSFLYADICFDVTKCKFIVKNSSFKILLVFSPIFVADTKITFAYNFVAPLKILENSQKKNSCQSLFFNKVAGWKPETVRSRHWICFVKKLFLKISQISQESLFNNAAVMRACNFIKNDIDTGAFL